MRAFLWIWTFIAMMVVTGCRSFDTGPDLATSVMDISKTGTSTFLANVIPTQAAATFTGELDRPEYEVATFVGNGLYVHNLYRLNGGELEFDVRGLAEGTGQLGDLGRIEALNEMMHRSGITESQRREWLSRIIQGLIDHGDPRAASPSTGGDQPPATDAGPG